MTFEREREVLNVYINIERDELSNTKQKEEEEEIVI